MDQPYDLRRRFGRLVTVHRKRRRLTQEGLAGATELSSDMIGRIEVGTTGASFATISKIASALRIDPAELFTTELDAKARRSVALIDLVARLEGLSDRDIVWIDRLLDAALKPRG